MQVTQSSQRKGISDELVKAPRSWCADTLSAASAVVPSCRREEISYMLAMWLGNDAAARRRPQLTSCRRSQLYRFAPIVADFLSSWRIPTLYYGSCTVHSQITIKVRNDFTTDPGLVK